MPLTYEQVKTILTNMSRGGYVPPIDPEVVGKCAFYYGFMIRDWWQSRVADGWEIAASKIFEGISTEDRDAAMAFAESIA